MQDPDFIQKRRTWGFWEEYYFQSSAFGWFVCIQEAVARHGQRSWQCKVMVSIWIKKESVSNKKNDLRERNCSSLRDVHTEENINWFFLCLRTGYSAKDLFLQMKVLKPETTILHMNLQWLFSPGNNSLEKRPCLQFLDRTTKAQQHLKLLWQRETFHFLPYSRPSCAWASYWQPSNLILPPHKPISISILTLFFFLHQSCYSLLFFTFIFSWVHFFYMLIFEGFGDLAKLTGAVLVQLFPLSYSFSFCDYIIIYSSLFLWRLI